VGWCLRPYPPNLSCIVARVDMSRLFVFCVALSAPVVLHAADVDRNAREAAEAAKNPIRKVVTMLQSMQKKVTAEGEKEQELYDKFMCYCKSGGSDLDASIEAGNAKIDTLTSQLKEAKEKKIQTEANLKDHQGSRSDAKDDMAKATALREKEAAAFAAEKSELDTNIAALGKAISAVDSGMAGSFLQSNSAMLLKQYAIDKADISDMARQELLAFLSGAQSQGYTPASGEISGILKQMKDEMSQNLKTATAEEESAIATYDALMAAKTKEVETLSAQIEEELLRIGELGVSVVSMEKDLEDTTDGVAEDSKFKREMAHACETKTAEWEETKKLRAEELVAISETIKVLNDDDALELFKKTLPGTSASASFVQIKTNANALRSRALAAINGAKANAQKAHLAVLPGLEFITLALNGKKEGFEKVIGMITEMIANLKQEQRDDDDKREYCSKQFDISEDKKKALEISITDSGTAIEDLQGSIATLKEEIKALQDGIKALDKSVLAATEQRKEEHADFTTLMANDAGAKDILNWAKNRLNKFYNPKLYKAPPKRELSEQDRIVENMSLVQISAHNANDEVDAPEPPPAAPGPFKKKTEESSGVIAMIDLLVKDLDKEMQEAGVSEKDSQADYEALMKESSAKRAQDSASLAEKTAGKAAAEEALESETEKKANSQELLEATMFYINSLHGECDWLIQYYDMRKTARSEEIDALVNAKAVLSGADFSLLQIAGRAPGFLAPHK